MIHRLVATAGVSVLSSHNLGGRWLEGEGAGLVRRDGAQLVPLGAPDELEARLIERWRRQRPTIEAPGRVSAEFSVVRALALAPEPAVVLLHSDTFAGRVAAALVADLLSQHLGAQVRRVQIAELDADCPEAVRRSMADFVCQLSRELCAGEPRSTAFSPIGGYKVMSAVGYLVGSYHGYPSVYLHEGRQLVHHVPPVPIQVDEGDLAQVADLVRRTRGAVILTDPVELAQVDARPWLFERDGELVGLSAFGVLLREDPRHAVLLQTRVRVAEPGSLRGREALVRSEVRQLLRYLADPVQHRALLSHGAALGHHGTTFQVYRTARGGAFRAAYRYDEAQDVLDLRRIWCDQHEVYEREVAAGRILGDHDGPWADVSERIWAPGEGR